MKQKIIRPSDITWPDNWDIKANGITQSLWSSWMKCNRLFLLQVNGYKSYDNKAKFNFGNLVHEVNDKVYTARKLPTKKEILGHIDDYVKEELASDAPISEQILEDDAAKAEATLIPYFEFYKKDFTKKKFYGTEELFKVEYNGITMRGKIDNKYIAVAKKWLMEHKTAGRIEEGTLIDYLALDFQNLYYNLADELQTGEAAQGTLYNIIRNTSSKPKVNESLLAYKKRIQITVEKDPGHFFKRWEVAYSANDRKIFRQDLDNMIIDFNHKKGKPVIANRFSCRYPFPCPMLRACSQNSCSDLTKTDDIEKSLYSELQPRGNKDASKKISKKVSKKIAKRKIAKRK